MIEGGATAAGSAPGGRRKVRVWDRPTRIFHWVLTVLFVVCYMSARNERFDVHLIAGQALLILVLARIVWGFAGSGTSRFRAFVRPPGELLASARTFFRRGPEHHVGHNPLGGLSVVVMLLAFLTQGLLGIFAIHVDGYAEGPLSFLVSYETGRQASQFHGMMVNVLLTLVALHLAAVLHHFIWKRENLIAAMFRGWAWLSSARPATDDRVHFVSDRRALLILILVAALVLGGFELAAHLW